MARHHKRSLSWSCWLALALLLAAATVLLVLALRSPFVWSLDIGAPNDERFIANFFPPEQNGAATFRWSGPGSRLVLHNVPDGRLRLSLRLSGDALVDAGTPRLRLQRHQQRDIAFDVAHGWRIYHVLLPDYQPPTPIKLVSALHYAGADDGRYLGVVLDHVEVAALTTTLHWTALLLALLIIGSVLVVPRTLLLCISHAPHIARRMARLLHRLVRWRYAPLVVLIVAHLLILPFMPLAWRGIGALLVLALPGMLLAVLLFPADELEGGTRSPLFIRLFLGLCGGVALTSLLVVALQALPGPLHWWLLLVVCDGVSLLVLVQSIKRGRQDPTPLPLVASHSAFPIQYALLLVLIIGAALRLPFLGSAEFQGDEGLAILAAVGILHGQDDVLLLRPKGPGEVVLPAGLLALTGQLHEWMARLPFALAGIGILVGGFVLARTLFHGCEREQDAEAASPFIALLATAILALDGFLVAYARIVQYQSIVVLMSMGALWCCWRFYTGAHSPLRYLLSAAVLAGVAMLAHYDGIFVLPAMAWLVLAGSWRRGWQPAQWLRLLAPPALVGAVLLLSFYLPLISHEHFATHTQRYLDWRIGQQGTVSTLFNNLPGYYQQATFYNTTFQIHALGLILLVALLVWLVRYGRPRLLGWLLAGLLLAGSAGLLWSPAWFLLPDGNNWAMVVFAVPLAGLALSPATPPALRVLVIWFAVPFTAMSFLIEVPNTHYYTMDVPAALLIALALVQVWRFSHQSDNSTRPHASSAAVRRTAGIVLRRGLLLAGVGLVLLALPYLVIVYVRQVPEYQRSFPAARPALYRASYGDGLPTGGYFGFPHRDGWKVVGELYRRGVLQGSYSSNQKERMTAWYTRGALRCSPGPDYYFLARGQSYVVPQGYVLWGYVVVDNIRAMDIYSQKPVATPQGYELNDYRSAFDTQMVPDFPLMGGLISGEVAACRE